MPRVTRKIICALLSLLLVMSGQAAVSGQDMPAGEQAPLMSGSMSDCGHANANANSLVKDGQHGKHAAPAFASSGCGDTDNVACMTSAGSGNCVLTVVFAHSADITSLEALSRPVAPGGLFAYRNPVLEVITPPPDFLS